MEFASNLNQAYQSVTARPSIFDLLAQDSLRSSLRPAFEFLIKTLSIRYPETLGAIVRFSDEAFHLLLATVEKHFIWNHGASFSEHFYGLTRVNIATNRTSSKLSSLQKVSSLICLTLLPYLKTKLEKYYNQVKEEIASAQTAWESLTTFQKCIKKIYPYIHATIEAMRLALIVCYTVKLVGFHSLTYDAFKMALTYSNGMTESQTSNNVYDDENSDGGILNIPKRIYQQIKHGCYFATEYALPVTVFFLKFLEWWYSSEHSPQNVIDTSQLPPPPRELQIGCSRYKLPAHPSQCPICHNIIRNPTALSRSGYVFCYACIYKFIEEKQHCPVTKMKCSLENLIKLHC